MARVECKNTTEVIPPNLFHFIRQFDVGRYEDILLLECLCATKHVSHGNNPFLTNNLC